MTRWLAHATAVAFLGFSFWWSSGARAQTSTESAAPSSAPARDDACFPPCRAGFICHAARCVSMCNPPCASGEVCVDGTRCEREVTAPAVVEPPPPPLEPRTFADRDYTALAFHLGFGGSVERNGVSQNLDTTLGFNIRGDVPVIRYMLIGPLLTFGSWRPDVAGSSHGYYLDVDFYLRGRIPIDLDKIGLSLWAGVPIGLTMDFLGGNLGSGLDGFGIGWNVGVLVGAAVHFTPRFGMFTEIGWLQHKMSHDASSGATSGSADFRLSQGVFNIGFIFGD
ncbi:MAG TPA: hypothetical protein VHC69_17775 [Polyangiaceae bacterium]|nr:hypothetical protein [Polyangiaceae bacterium]